MAGDIQRSNVRYNLKSFDHFIFRPFFTATFSPLRALSELAAIRYGIKRHRFWNPLLYNIIA